MAALDNNVDAVSSRNVMVEAEVIGISQATCSVQYGGGIDDGMVCAAAPGKDSCQGDSGEPMVNANGNDRTLVGVVSFGQGCAYPNYAGVYTRVSFYRQWVDDKITTNTNTCSSASLTTTQASTGTSPSSITRPLPTE
ncbi:PREDICTED: trypsin delta/gamma-like [Priapulus caudatus]|uniref:Trypsin delta/gamma-like n=1 Tax=Priapulus caudatus TaxID=37621 RepID=A0ABM1E471_PRICU|nr:PREDICTED: trypsin delta/gamma-like [Priapulus caudatus]